MHTIPLYYQTSHGAFHFKNQIEKAIMKKDKLGRRDRKATLLSSQFRGGVAMTKQNKIKEAIKRKFPVIHPNDTLQDAITQMAHSNVSVLAVKTGEEFIGMVTVTDVMFSLSRGDDMETTPVEEFMTKCEYSNIETTRNPFIQLDEEQGALSAVKLMYGAGINHLLVSGADGKPAGIVSSLEVIKILAGQPQQP